MCTRVKSANVGDNFGKFGIYLLSRMFLHTAWELIQKKTKKNDELLKAKMLRLYEQCKA